ncbi:MAG: hypothetical protein HC875_03970 [Anaerolineales bacterium]|nr:hypothetical protein [Anaerolineales bacterium]
MNTGELIAAIEAELAQVEGQLISSVGTSSMCALEKSNKVTQSMKYLEGQQQGYRGAIKTLRASAEKEMLLKYMSDEKIKNEQMLNGPVGASTHWQEYLKGSLAALQYIQELLDTARWDDGCGTLNLTSNPPESLCRER